MSISAHLNHSLLFHDGDWIQELKGRETRLPFFYEVMAEWKRLSETPWETPALFLDSYFKEWKVSEIKLTELFSQRKKSSARTEMIAQIGYFLEAMFWMNGIPASPGTWKEKFDSLDVKPINGKERIAFVIDHPDHYIALIQLGELIDEIHKKWKVKELRTQIKTK